MSDYISREAASADECKHKIKTPFAKIIVGGTPEKPCYCPGCGCKMDLEGDK